MTFAPPPAGAFDVRYRRGWFACTSRRPESTGFPDSCLIRRFPMTASWDLGERPVRLRSSSITGKSLLTGKQSVRIWDPASAILLRIGSGGSAERFPRTFSLDRISRIRSTPATHFNYSGCPAGLVTLKVYERWGEKWDDCGRGQGTGVYRVEWDAGSFPSGVYTCRMQAGSFSSSKKVLLLR